METNERVKMLKAITNKIIAYRMIPFMVGAFLVLFIAKFLMIIEEIKLCLILVVFVASIFAFLEGEKKIEKLEQDKKIVNILISSLDEETKFIVVQKHFENKKWNIITHQFNSNYRNQYHEYITSAGVRKKYEVAKKGLSSLLEEIMQVSSSL